MNNPNRIIVLAGQGQVSGAPQLVQVFPGTEISKLLDY